MTVSNTLCVLLDNSEWIFESYKPNVFINTMNHYFFKTWDLISPCLALSIIRFVPRVKWGNPRKGVAPFLTPQCGRYWKENLRVALDEGRRLYITIIYNFLLCSYRISYCILLRAWLKRDIFEESWNSKILSWYHMKYIYIESFQLVLWYGADRLLWVLEYFSLSCHSQFFELFLYSLGIFWDGVYLLYSNFLLDTHRCHTTNGFCSIL